MIIFGVITLGLFIWGLWIATYSKSPMLNSKLTYQTDNLYSYPDYIDSVWHNRIARRQAIADAMTDVELIRILRVHQSLIKDEWDRAEFYGDEVEAYTEILMNWHGRIEHWIKCIQSESWLIDPDDKYADYIAKKQINDAKESRENARRWVAHPVYEFLWIALEQL